MWDDGNQSTAGGYFNDTMQSPSGAAPTKKIYKAQNCVPVSIQQINNSNEDDFKIGKSTDVHLVTILALLVEKQTDSTKSSYLFDDGSGSINAFIFNCSENGIATEKDYPVNKYYRVFGSVRIQDKKHHIMTFKLEPLQSIEELTMHWLEVMYVPMNIEELELEEQGAPGSSNSNAHRVPGNSSMGLNGNSTYQRYEPAMNSNYGGGASAGGNHDGNDVTQSGLTPHQNAVFQAIKNAPTEKGLDKPGILAAVKVKMNAKDIDNTIDFLIGEGHIYSTFDEQHYRTTT